MSTETVPFDDESFSAVVSRNVTAARARARISQSMVAARMKALGYSWYQQTIGAIERGERRVEVAELLGLALVLGTSVGSLLDPSDDDPFVELPSGTRLPTGTVQRSVRGHNDGFVGWLGDDLDISGTTWPYPMHEAGPELASDNALGPFLDRLSPKARARVASIIREEPVMSGEQLAVVAAIVTSSRGVLIGRRIDGKPPWTFIAGEQEPGERPADTIIREVKEETGLDIRAGEVIGERDHPATGRHMIYMAARPARGTDVFVGDEAELTEVKWASLAEAEELLPGMFPPVRDYLAGKISEAGS